MGFLIQRDNVWNVYSIRVSTETRPKERRGICIWYAPKQCNIAPAKHAIGDQAWSPALAPIEGNFLSINQSNIHPFIHSFILIFNDCRRYVRVKTIPRPNPLRADSMDVCQARLPTRKHYRYAYIAGSLASLVLQVLHALVRSCIFHLLEENPEREPLSKSTREEG